MDQGEVLQELVQLILVRLLQIQVVVVELLVQIQDLILEVMVDQELLF